MKSIVFTTGEFKEEKTSESLNFLGLFPLLYIPSILDAAPMQRSYRESAVMLEMRILLRSIS